MRVAVIADIHGNLAALEATLGKIEEQKIDRIVSLGDIVGYGPDPGACIRRLRDLPVEHIQGNHEARLLDLPTGRFNLMAEAAIQYAKSVLGPEDTEFLRSFPKQARIGDHILAVHGSPFDRDEYVLSLGQMKAVLDEIDTWVCMCGHTHQQYVFDGDIVQMGPLELDLDPERRFLVNPGSVGQPRDGDPRAAYGLLDVETGHLVLDRVAYDVEDTAERIQRAGLPEYLATRLLIGR
jgi:diadenosine tetraphosphatase ApaH/serine/threonine PP2A family protein phosphatase